MKLNIIEVITIKVTMPSSVNKELVSAHATLSMIHAEKYKHIHAVRPAVYTLGNVRVSKVGAPFMDEIEMQDFVVEFQFFKDLK